MVLFPAVVALIKPDTESIVATDILLLDHVPPDVELESVVVAPAQTLATPEILAGDGITDTLFVLRHPVEGKRYVIIALPVSNPYAQPDEVVIVAFVVSLLLHVALVPDAPLNTAFVPTQMVDGPVITPGNGLTANEYVLNTLGLTRYVTVTPPDVTPVNTPVTESIVAVAGLLVVHVPPVVV